MQAIFEAHYAHSLFTLTTKILNSF